MGRRFVLEVVSLEARRLLSATPDLNTTAQVTAITHGVAVVQPVQPAYATAADSVQIRFTASDADHPGARPTTHVNITDTTTGAVVVHNGTGTTWTLAAQGVYQVQFWSTDADDSEPVAAHTIWVAIDRTAPTITIATVSPNILWPPNGKFVAVHVTGVATDSLSGVNPATLRFSVQDEYGKVQPSGAITDITEVGRTPFGGFQDVAFSFQVMLQARRHGFDFDGRQYTIMVSAFDMAGNAGANSAMVLVPHDMGHHGGHHHPRGRGPIGGPGGGGSGVGSHRSGHHHGKAGENVGRHGESGSSSTGPGSVIGPLPNPDNGHRHGQGNSEGNGHGHGNGKGSGQDQGNDQGNGGGKGNGHDQGNGNGDGNDQGNGGGNGNGHDQGNGNGHDQGHGDGGDGNGGNGHGKGHD
jgi:hypothetical protein